MLKVQFFEYSYLVVPIPFVKKNILYSLSYLYQKSFKLTCIDQFLYSYYIPLTYAYLYANNIIPGLLYLHSFEIKRCKYSNFVLSKNCLGCSYPYKFFIN